MERSFPAACQDMDAGFLPALSRLDSGECPNPAVRTFTVKMGSGLKFCRIAEGQADMYIRPGRTMEWDTAAPHAVLEAAGGAVLTMEG